MFVKRARRFHPKQQVNPHQKQFCQFSLSQRFSTTKEKAFSSFPSHFSASCAFSRKALHHRVGSISRASQNLFGLPKRKNEMMSIPSQATFSTPKKTGAAPQSPERPKSIAKSLSGPTISQKPELYPYLLENSLREHEILRKLRTNVIESHPQGVMSSSPEQVQFLNFLLKSLNAKKVMEVGSFFGYGTIGMALALPQNGKLIGLDIDRAFISVADEYIQQIPGLGDIVEFKIGPATESMASLIPEHSNTFDFIYIDANKNDYPTYYEHSLKLVRQGGIVGIDNTFFHGTVLDPSHKMGKTLHNLNQFLHSDERIDLSMLPVADGFTLCRKK